MGGKALIAISTPCNLKGKVSGHRIVEYCNRRLSVLSCEMNSEDSRTNTDANVQAFCYLTPKDGIISPVLSDGIMDTSDYMILAKSNGFIEVIKDYHYMIERNIPLNPAFILKCTPEDFSNTGSNFMFASVKYKDGLLYCCMCSGKIFIFLLNLPCGYIQVENAFVKTSKSTERYDFCTNFVNDLTGGPQSVEESTLYLKMRFTGRTKLRHICYYLLPMEPEHLRNCPSLFLVSNSYRDYVIYKPSMFVSLNEDISDFCINPFDRLSFFTISPGTPLIIRKIMLPMAYVNFFIKFVNIKERFLDMNGEEVASWNQVAKDMKYDSFRSYLIDDPQENVDIDSAAFDQLATFDNISLLRTIIVWMQRTNHWNDDLSRLFGQNESSNGHINRSIIRSPSFRRVSRHALPGRSLQEPRELSSENLEVAPFLKEVRRNTFTVDFKVIQLNQDPINSDVQHFSREGENVGTSFLTDNYKKMDIICIDRYLSLSIFRPSNLNFPITSIESFHVHEDINNRSKDILFEQENEFKRALNGLTSFKKIFPITDSLFMILDMNGVILLDREQLCDSKNLMKNPECAARIAPFNIGLISDAALIIQKLEKCTITGGYNVNYDLIVTCLPGEIMAFEGKFTSNSKIANLKLCDTLRLKKKNKFVDKLCLLSYDPSFDNKKRHQEHKEVYPLMKKKKLDLKVE